MNSAERSILTTFRRFGVGPRTMLCFQGLTSDHQMRGMQVLIDKGMVTKERPRHAYSLTTKGYQASLLVLTER